MKDFISRHIVFIFFLLLAAGLVFLSFNFNSKRQQAIIHSDAEGYYLYLPAVFIYSGFKSLPVKTTNQFPRDKETGRVITRYTYGVALLEAPFFFFSHLAAKIMGYEANGYSPVYASGLMMSGVFYAWLGLLFLFREIRKHFSYWIGIFAVICLFFGTNLYYYSIAAPGMSHVYSFFLFSLTITLVSGFYKRPSRSLSMLIGLATGLAVLIRPTNIVIILFLIWYRVYSWKDFRERLEFIMRHFSRFFFMAVVAIIVFLPQFSYWKHISGKWLYYSYGNQTFANWNKPRILNVLFDVQNGWLVYSPMAVLALVGLLLATRRKDLSAPVIWLILALSIYAFASWWSWCFCAAFGGRSFVELYALLALPLAYLIQKTGSLKIFQKSFLILVFCFFIFYNLKLSYIYNGLWEGPEWTWQSLGEVLFPLFQF